MVLRKLSFACLLLVPYFYWGQTSPPVIVQGKVFDARDTSGIYKAEVVLKDDRGRVLHTLTDSVGYYYFAINDNFFSTAEVSIQVNTSTYSKLYGKGYLSSEEKGKLSLPDPGALPVRFIKDFRLVQGCTSPDFPHLLFDKNKSGPESLTCVHLLWDGSGNPYQKEETEGLKFLSRILYDNPNIVIEVAGHTSKNEKRKNKLSCARAETVKKLLVSHGIHPGRIVPKGYGASKQRMPVEHIKKSKTKVDREKLHAANRRCVFKILSWDFKEEK